MAEDVKAQAARNRRSQATQERLIAAAGRLFVEKGYRATTLADVAQAAGVAPRTVYVRFGTKALLFHRVMDVAVVGDTAPVDLAHRDWVLHSLTAPTLAERLGAQSAGVADLFSRLGPLMPVAHEAALDDPGLAAAAQAAREDTTAQLAAWWRRAAEDGLLHPGVDLDWVIATSALLGSADTYVLMTRILPWGVAEYRDWRHRTWWHLATTPSDGQVPPVPRPA